MNTFGTLFTLTSFGESHGAAIGGVIDGMPAGIAVDMDFVRSEMRRRRPGQSAVTTGRHEPDEVEFISGIFEGCTTGAPIGFFVRNTSQHSADYDNLRDVYRPSHADFTYQQKYGEIPNQFAADAYDGVYAIKAAIEKTGVTPDMKTSDICDKLKVALTEISIDGVTAKGLTWDANGEPSKAPMVLMIENGEYTIL